MDRLVGLLDSSISSSSPSVLDNRTGPTAYNGSTGIATSPMETLPVEIITYILTFLSPVSLAAVSATSHRLRYHAQAEPLWQSFIRDNIHPQNLMPSPSPAKSWRDLYISHHPYWFLPRHKIWFSDQPDSGAILIAWYDPRRACIEAYRLLARHGSEFIQPWTHNPAVNIQFFDPILRLWLDDPLIKLDFKEGNSGNRLQKEVNMRIGYHPTLSSLLSLCYRIPPERQHPSMSLWPPSTIPSSERVRNESPNLFRGDEQRPKTLSTAGDRTFRIRKFLQYNNSVHPLGVVRMGEDVTTWSTLLEESYTPTKQKPWQGIWVGDYGNHGCEFLLITQRDRVECPTRRPIRRASTASGLPSGVTFGDTDSDNGSDTQDNRAVEASHPDYSYQEAADEPSGAPSGRLEAIKLTGDINVPRGQCTWFAEDIGDGGLVRIADDEVFRGARIVKSMGHVADRDFKNARYLQSQLIMKDHDTLAQFWEV
ncbi:MAG: hypothetical protein Q9163_002474 [Psora crenata]